MAIDFLAMPTASVTELLQTGPWKSESSLERYSDLFQAGSNGEGVLGYYGHVKPTKVLGLKFFNTWNTLSPQIANTVGLYKGQLLFPCSHSWTNRAHRDKVTQLLSLLKAVTSSGKTNKFKKSFLHGRMTHLVCLFRSTFL